MSQNSHDGVRFVQYHNSTVQIGHRDIVTLDAGGSWHTEACDHLFDELSVETIMNQAALRFVVAIAYEKPVRFIAGIQNHAVSRIELLHSIPLLAEVHQVLAVLIELEDVIAGVTIRQKDVVIGCYRNRCWIEAVNLESRFFGEF